MIRLQLRLDEETFSALAAKAVRSGYSMPEVAEVLIRDGLVSASDRDTSSASPSPLMSPETQGAPALGAAA